MSHLNTFKCRALLVIAFVESMMIVALLLQPHPPYKYAITYRKPRAVGPSTNPFDLAFKYDAPDWKVLQLCKQYPQWISYRDPHMGRSALMWCADEERTNLALMLIANGADVETAILEERKEKNETSVGFLEKMEAVVKRPIATNSARN